MKRLALLVLICLPITGLAQEIPSQKIEGAETTIPLGELVTLNISAIKDRPATLISWSATWKIFDGTKEKKFAVDSTGNVFFGAGLKDKELLAVAAVTYVFNVDNKVIAKTVILSTKVVVGDGTPPSPPNPPVPPEPPTPPNPPPTPPDPTPNFDEGKYGLAKFTYDTALAKVPATNRKTGATALAGSFSGTASAAAAGTIKTFEDMLKQVKEGNDKALGENINSWEGFSDVLQEKLFGLYQSGKLTTIDDLVLAFREISSGLSYVK